MRPIDECPIHNPVAIPRHPAGLGIHKHHSGLAATLQSAVSMGVNHPIPSHPAVGGPEEHYVIMHHARPYMYQQPAVLGIHKLQV
jgi:hypothetical protein